MTQIDQWRGEFGDAYTERNQPDESAIAGLTLCFSEPLRYTGDLESICEVGANTGRNLLALSRLTTAQLTGVEPNRMAREKLAESFAVVDGHLGSEPLPLGDREFDMVLVAGVLIHTPPELLDASADELARIAGRYLLVVEYFNPTPIEVEYRGMAGMMWKRDYGRLFLDRGWRHMASGFWWKPVTPSDDSNWWLFRR